MLFGKLFEVDPRLCSILTRLVAGHLFNDFLAIYRNPVLQLDERHVIHELLSVSLDRHSTIRSNGNQLCPGAGCVRCVAF